MVRGKTCAGITATGGGVRAGTKAQSPKHTFWIHVYRCEGRFCICICENSSQGCRADLIVANGSALIDLMGLVGFQPIAIIAA